MQIPRNPVTPPRIASNKFSGKWPAIPNSFNAICTNIVMRILEEPTVAVRDAPTLLKPVEYDKEPTNDISENKNRVVTDTNSGCRGKENSFDPNIV